MISYQLVAEQRVSTWGDGDGPTHDPWPLTVITAVYSSHMQPGGGGRCVHTGPHGGYTRERREARGCGRLCSHRGVGAPGSCGRMSLACLNQSMAGRELKSASWGSAGTVRGRSIVWLDGGGGMGAFMDAGWGPDLW